MKINLSIIESVIDDLKIRLRDNLISVYGIGSYFDDSLPVNFITNDIDLIVIVSTTKNLPKFITRNIEKSEIFVGYNTI